MRLPHFVVLVVGGAMLAGCSPGSSQEASRPTATPLPQQLNPDAEIRAARLFTPTSGWVLTVDRLLTTTDSGRTWANVTPPRIVATAAALSGSIVVPPASASLPTAQVLETAFFLNPTLGWAVIRAAQVSWATDTAPLELLSSSDGGHHWNARKMPATIPLDTPGPVYLTFIDAMRGWLVVDLGSNANFMKYDGFQTTDGGLTWTPMAYPQSAPVLFVNQIDGFSVGDGGYPKSGAYATHDGGRTWARLALPPSGKPAESSLFELPVFSDDRNGVLAGEVLDASGGTASEVFYKTSDAGRSWRLAAIVPNPEPQFSAQPAGVVSGKVWLAGFDGPGPIAGRSYTRLRVTLDGGTTWKWLPPILTGGFADEISFSGPTGWGILVEAGCRGFKTDCFTNWGLFQTVDTGAHWMKVSVT